MTSHADGHERRQRQESQLPTGALTAALAETEPPLAELATPLKVIAELVPIGPEPDLPETNTARQGFLTQPGRGRYQKRT